MEPTKPLISLLDNDDMLVELPKRNLMERGFEVVHHRHAVTALPDFTHGRQYRVIVMNAFVAPGEGCTDPKIDELVKAYRERGEEERPYGKIALRMIELIKARDSLNSRTPIVVAATMPSEGDVFLFLNIEQRVLEAGATEYVNMIPERGSGYDTLYRRIERLTARRR